MQPSERAHKTPEKENRLDKGHGVNKEKLNLDRKTPRICKGCNKKNHQQGSDRKKKNIHTQPRGAQRPKRKSESTAKKKKIEKRLREKEHKTHSKGKTHSGETTRNIRTEQGMDRRRKDADGVRPWRAGRVSNLRHRGVEKTCGRRLGATGEPEPGRHSRDTAENGRNESHEE
ncbi:Hypothetical predicted protein [Pelobates cultripes]|uniref:Uncharacterized protein n=1 Tax=Pelobates cultripes TaxID=61616 RepID=A0AAD1QZ22_PELCU|nr:Hypothetical predicted protein [Pelobates cultripes]